MGLIFSSAWALMFVLVLPQLAEAVIRPVRDVQQALAAKGFDPGKPDGFWGNRSVAALRAFQKQSGLPETGVIDDNCLRLLLPANPEPPVADAAPASQSEKDVSSAPIAAPAQAAPNLPSPAQPIAGRDTSGSGSGAGIFSAVVCGIGALILLARRGRRKA